MGMLCELPAGAVSNKSKFAFSIASAVIRLMMVSWRRVLAVRFNAFVIAILEMFRVDA